jgi:hypothetical protein
MRNVLDKVVEKIKTHFTFNNIFFENHAVYEIMSKNMVEPEGSQKTSQYDASELHTLDKQGYMHARVCTLPRARAHARAQHTQIYNIYCFFTVTMICERASMLRTYIVCLL